MTEIKFRLTGFALAIVLLAGMIVWAASSSWEKVAELRAKLTSTQLASFDTADYFQAHLQELDYKLLRYLVQREPVDREQFGVHLDLVNLINSPRAYWSSGSIMNECVRLFGARIVAAHAKDVKLREPAISVMLEEVIAGEGGLDIAAFIRGLHQLPAEVPLMLEHLASEQEYDRAAAHYRAIAAREGISI